MAGLRSRDGAAGMIFTVNSLAKTKEWMTERGIQVRMCGDRLMVHPGEAGNTALFFEQGPVQQ